VNQENEEKSSKAGAASLFLPLLAGSREKPSLSLPGGLSSAAIIKTTGPEWSK